MVSQCDQDVEKDPRVKGANARPWWSQTMRGFVIAGLGALFFSAYCQLEPRWRSLEHAYFTGAPGGLDEWVYFALARAVWRSPTLLSYAYPFALFWPAPPVMIQWPLAVAAWMGQVVGLPLAFEILRVVGAAFTGAAIFSIAGSLFYTRRARRLFTVLAFFGGGWFWAAALLDALRTAGPYGLTEIPVYVERVMGPLFWWLPFLAPNVWLPLEMLYHAEVLSALALLLRSRSKAAALVGLATWFSNPFPALSLYAAVLPWVCLRAAEVLVRERRVRSVGALALWLATGLIGYGYYGVFLQQWPVLAELARMHQVPLAPPPTAWQLLAWFGPFVPAIAWSIATARGRSCFLSDPAWRLVGLLVLTQWLFLVQFWVLGQRAVQPYHFNRGYLAVGCAAVTTRWLLEGFSAHGTFFWRRMFVASLTLDVLFFFLRILSNGIETGFVPKNIEEVRRLLASRQGTQVLLSSAYPYNVYFAASTDHIPYDMPETMVIPWAKERSRLLEAAKSKGPDAVAALGISLAVLTEGDDLLTSLTASGWHLIGRSGTFAVLELPPSLRHPVPKFPPPTGKD